MKVCSSCKLVKTFSDFDKDASRIDGFVYRCKVCIGLASASSYARRKEKIAAQRLITRSANRESAALMTAAWARANPEKRRANRASYRARKRGAIGRHSGADIALLMRLQRGKCACCHVGIKSCYHIDHILPLVLGGANGKENLQLLCPTCNTTKGSKDPIRFAQQLGRLL